MEGEGGVAGGPISSQVVESRLRQGARVTQTLPEDSMDDALVDPGTITALQIQKVVHRFTGQPYSFVQAASSLLVAGARELCEWPLIQCRTR